MYFIIKLLSTHHCASNWIVVVCCNVARKHGHIVVYYRWCGGNRSLPGDGQNKRNHWIVTSVENSNVDANANSIVKQASNTHTRGARLMTINIFGELSFYRSVRHLIIYSTKCNYILTSLQWGQYCTRSEDFSFKSQVPLWWAWLNWLHPATNRAKWCQLVKRDI